MDLHLKQGGKLLGTLCPYDSDMFWTNCKFESTEAFQKFKPLFDEELRLLEDEDWDKWEEVYNRITSLKLELINLENGKIIDEFLLHIQDDEARLRY